MTPPPNFTGLSWTPLTKNGTIIADTNGDTPLDERAIVGAATPTSPAVASAYISSDVNWIYFRLRIDVNPGSGTNIRNFAWGCQIDTDHNVTNSWESIAIVSGKNNAPPGVHVLKNVAPVTAGEVVACPISPVNPDCPPGTNTWNADDLADQSVVPPGNGGLPYSLTSNTNTITTALAGEPSTKNNTPDYFYSWAVKKTDLAIDNTTALRFVCGTNSNGDTSLTTGGSGDIVGLFNYFSDPIICGDTGCNTCNTVDTCGVACGPCDNPNPICNLNQSPPPSGYICQPCSNTFPCPDGEICQAGSCVEPECTGVVEANPDCADTPGTPFCVNNKCVECIVSNGMVEGCTNSSTPGNEPVCNGSNQCTDCDPSTNRCDQQYTGLPACKALDPNGTQCVECTTDDNCFFQPNGETSCATTTNTCHDCFPTQDNPNAGCDPNGTEPHCIPSGDNALDCGPCVSDDDCDNAGNDAHHCQTNMNEPQYGECVQCTDNRQCDQPPEGQFVSPTCLTDMGHVCGPCSMAGDGAAECQDDDPMFQACNSGGSCVECTVDNDCREAVTGKAGLVCDAATQTCGECSPTNMPADGCTADVTEPICHFSQTDNNYVCQACSTTPPLGEECPTGQCLDDDADQLDGACVECLDTVHSSDCPAVDFPICGTDHACRICGEMEEVPTDGDMECEDKNAPAPNQICADADGSTTKKGQCVACNPDTQFTDCSSTTTPQCNDHVCGDCSSDAACTGYTGTEACQTQAEADFPGTCRQCNDDPDCAAVDGKHKCELNTGVCVECTSEAQCTDEGEPVCDPDSHTCVPTCTVDADCEDPMKPVCNHTLGNICTECSNDGDNPGQVTLHQKLCTDACRVCDGTTGSCEDCLGDNDCADDAPAQTCTHVGALCDENTRKCVQCFTNPDCADIEGKPYCNTVSNLCTDDCTETTVVCPEDVPICAFEDQGQVSMGTCYECTKTDSTKCDGTLLPKCDIDNGVCVKCNIKSDCAEDETCDDHVCVVIPPPDAGPPDAPLPPDAAPPPIDAAAPPDAAPPPPDAKIIVPPDAFVEPEADANEEPPIDAAPPAIDAMVLPPDAKPVDARLPDAFVPPPVDATPSQSDAMVLAPDATVPPDAPVAAPDAKSPDAVVAADATIASDAKVSDARSTDAVVTPITPNGFIEGGGCSCRVDGEHRAPAGTGFWLLLGLAGVVVRIRRRRK